MGEDGSNPALDAFRNFAVSFCDLAALNIMKNICETGFNSTFSDFKLHKEGSMHNLQ